MAGQCRFHHDPREVACLVMQTNTNMQPGKLLAMACMPAGNIRSMLESLNEEQPRTGYDFWHTYTCLAGKHIHVIAVHFNRSSSLKQTTEICMEQCLHRVARGRMAITNQRIKQTRGGSPLEGGPGVLCEYFSFPGLP